MGYLFSLILLGLIGWVTNTWVVAHGLAELGADGNWIMVAHGWAGLGRILVAVLLPGMLSGFVVGLKLNGLINSWLSNGDEVTRQRLVEERQKIEGLKSQLDSNILAAARKGRQEGEQLALESDAARFAAEAKVRAMARREKNMEGRMIGAQQKAVRMKKKAHLMSRPAAKPD